MGTHYGAYSDWQSRLLSTREDTRTAGAHAIPRWYEFDISLALDREKIDEVKLDAFKLWIDALIAPYSENSEFSPDLFIDHTEAQIYTWLETLYSESGFPARFVVLIYSRNWQAGLLKLPSLGSKSRVALKFSGSPMPISPFYEADGVIFEQSVTGLKRSYHRPIGGVVDDGIGFFNQRFRHSGTGGNRFVAMWLQGHPVQDPQTKRYQSGKVLSNEEIQKNTVDIQSSLLGEFCAYERYQKELGKGDSFGSTSRRSTHGTAVADLAFGVDKDDIELSSTGLIGVQLPRSSVADTSGVHLATNVLQGVRWIIQQAYCQTFKRGPDEDEATFSPLVINISLGAHAGDKFGGGFVGQEIDRVLGLYEQLTRDQETGDTDDFARVVYSFGNHHNDNLCAEISCADTVGWRIKPDDKTASYLELRSFTEQDVPPPVCIAGPNVVEKKYKLCPGESQEILDKDGLEVGRVYAEPDYFPGRKATVVALAPTASYEVLRGLATPGLWYVTLPSDYSGTVGVQVQRDDTPVGYSIKNRQSHLESLTGGEYDCDSHRYEAAELPLQKKGNHSSWVGSERSLAAGAARYMIGKAVSSSSSSSGVGNSANNAVSNIEAPNCSAVASLSRTRPGILASGTLTGSMSRIMGTSAAAPQLSRYLMLQLISKGRIEHLPPDPGFPRLGNEKLIPLVGKSSESLWC